MYPKKEIRELIDSYKDKFMDADKTIGLQIRRYEAYQISSLQEELFWRCANSLSISNKTKWFLATDDVNSRERLKNLLGNRLLYIDSPISKSKEGIINAIAELWLLGEADDIIISPYSTFGSSAHARTKLIPYVVTKNLHCMKLLSAEPCFHFWSEVVRNSVTICI